MSLKKIVSAMLLASMSSACMTLRPVASPAQFIPKANPPLVYVMYNDNSIVPVVQPKVSGDTLLGTWAGLSEPVAIPFRDIQLVQAKQPARGRTRLLIAGLAALTAASVYTVLKVTGNAPATCTGPGTQPGVDIC